MYKPDDKKQSPEEKNEKPYIHRKKRQLPHLCNKHIKIHFGLKESIDIDQEEQSNR